MAFAAFNVHHRADAAGVVLKPGVVQRGVRPCFIENRLGDKLCAQVAQREPVFHVGTQGLSGFSALSRDCRMLKKDEPEGGEGDDALSKTALEKDSGGGVHQFESRLAGSPFLYKTSCCVGAEAHPQYASTEPRPRSGGVLEQTEGSRLYLPTRESISCHTQAGAVSQEK